MKGLFISLCFYLSFWTIFAQLNYEEDINKFLFPEDRHVEFIDLTHTFDKSNAKPGSSAGEICVAKAVIDESEQYTRRKNIANIPLNELILPLIIVDVGNKVNGDPNFVLQKYDLDYMINNYFGRTDQPCLVVFKFGWTKYYEINNVKRFTNVYYEFNERLNGSHPGISEDLAKWITKSYKNIIGVGVDTPSVDPRNAPYALAFRALTDAGVYVLNHVKLDQYLPEYLCTAVVSPLKTSTSCSPYRLTVICPKSSLQPKEARLHHL